MKQALFTTALLASASVASAQSTIYGLDVRLGNFFTTDTQDFVGNYTIVAAQPVDAFALDFDATATTIWGVVNPATAGTPVDYGTFDLLTGAFTVVGQLSGVGGGPAPASATGLTAHPDGVTWYLSENVGGTNNLWRGNITTGQFQLVGTANIATLIIDIAIDNQGNLFANSISTDSLYSVDTNTGALTLIGPTGFATNFAQGMDFDWSTNTLYATFYTGGGTGTFASVNLATGAGTPLAVTTPLNAEMEITMQVAAGAGGVGTNYCTAVANSTGNTGAISGAGSAVVANNNLTLEADSLPNNSFGFFLTSTTQGFVANPGGSAGNLCVGGAIGRYVGPGQIKNSGTTGSFSLLLNLSQTPQPAGTVAIAAGQTWNFQAWYRDVVGGSATSNFTNGLSVNFQ